MRRNSALIQGAAAAATIALSLGMFAGTAHAQDRSGPAEGAHADARTLDGIDRPMAEAWPATRQWDEGMEQRFGEFVSSIGHAVAAGRCRTLAGCLNDPTINPLYETARRPLRLRSDCGDVPYLLRAYFSYRNELPFAYARRMRGRGHDPRYMTGSQPEGQRLWTDFRTPRALFTQISSDVHSGFYRTAPDIETADFYPAEIERGAVRPGTTFYNPNGHVLIVYEVRPDGEVLFFDGHVGNGLSHPHFSTRFPLGGRFQGGGFKNFRPFTYADGHIVQRRNDDLPDYGGYSQYDRGNFVVDGQWVGYHAWVRERLTAGPQVVGRLIGRVAVATRD